MNISDKATRRALLDLYMEAGTTAAEEIALAQWFASHGASPDEEAVAKLIAADHPLVEALSGVGEAEYDRIVGKASVSGRKRFSLRVMYYAAGAAAAVILFFAVRASLPGRPEFTPLEIVEEINALMSVGIEEIESISAKPNGRCVMVTAQMKDGSSSTYRMTRDAETGAIQFLAMK